MTIKDLLLKSISAPRKRNSNPEKYTNFILEKTHFTDKSEKMAVLSTKLEKAIESSAA
ncbi:hypothetical protein MHBO_000986 [Bonamia ostreae]|uniref:Uncharacterized protein n=1 Tax=Bonamia ostreae TaxID=126728 RepID=A0ABV2AHG9_9EUKA